MALGCSACRPGQAAYDRIKTDVDRGNFSSTLASVNSALLRWGDEDSLWKWRFLLLKARILVSRSETKAALALLGPEPPPALSSTEIPEQRWYYLGVAHRLNQQFSEAKADFLKAQELVGHLLPVYSAQLLIAQAAVAVDERDYSEAERDYRNALAVARQHGSLVLQADSLADLARLATLENRFDEALDLYSPALRLSEQLQMQGNVATILGNLGWSHYELGDFESSLEYYKQGAEASAKTGLPVLSAYWFSGMADAYIAMGDYAAAEHLARSTLADALRLKNAQTTTACLNTLTRVLLRTGRIAEAKQFNEQALQMEESGQDKFGTPESKLLAGSIAAAEKRFAGAYRRFQDVFSDATAETPLRWEAQSGQAGVRDAMGETAEAGRLYRAAIATIEKARRSINHDELRLSFLSSGIAVYGDYIDFLVRHGRAADALKQAELSRARTLAEGLAADEPVRANAPLHPESLARRLRASLLIYWLGQKHSYLWVITPEKTVLVSLPAAGEIEPLAKSYRQAQAAGADVLHTAAADGEKLYELLVAPAKKFIPADSRVVVLPDGALYTLNFETLIVPEPRPHFWIEDVTLTTANSLTLLASGAAGASHSAAPGSPAAPCLPRVGFGKAGSSSLRVNKSSCAADLLLVGDALQASADFPPLPQAPKEMALVEKYFPADQRVVLSRQKATASAYLASNPERYSYLHFVTHGTASRTRPLESAVILSPESSEGDAYKLYARDIVKHRLNAHLVTISACNGSGTRAYSGEGLVGLSWAFLRAGAHNVIGALWEVSDTATPQLMNQLYSELTAGKDPATALRDAKLKFIHSGNVFAKPFYWAPFQLYSGS